MGATPTDTTLNELLSKAEADLVAKRSAVEQWRADAERANAGLAAAEQDADRMEDTCAWLRAEIAAREGGEAAEPSARPLLFGKPMPETPQTDLCLEAIGKLGGSGSNKQIRSLLAREGHDLSLEQVRGSLKYLSKKKDAPVESPSLGEWRLTRGAAMSATNGAVRRP
jgi:hypothetical protein